MKIANAAIAGCVHALPFGARLPSRIRRGGHVAQVVKESGAEGNRTSTIVGRRCDSCHGGGNCYGFLITSSARSSTVWGIAIPRAFAVSRLITSSYRVGCSTGSSAGLAPFRILST